ncbi:MAG: hypothetical protein GY854_27265 [Deltaproteobacteria bacterium]|nr:hypothetical protein [Deltaproteobacteria bacterium]
MQEEFDIDVDWRGFELHPETKPGGILVEKLLGTKRAEGFFTYLKRFAADFDVPVESPKRVPNTRKSLAITEYARELGKLEAFRDAVMEAHWLEGKDIESDTDLGELAERIGLDSKDALSAGDDPIFLGRVDAAREEAQGRKVTVLPTLILGDFRVVGCQSYDSILKKTKKAGLQRR